ncbi:MAG: GYD domain-containing protein, partial [Solirubrobacteraceae bacterium]
LYFARAHASHPETEHPPPSDVPAARSILYNESGARHAGANAAKNGGAMPTYIMLSTLTPEGVQTVKNNPERIREVNKEVEQLGATVKAQWATLGNVDFISVVEAPDEKTMARVSLELGSRGTGRYETLAAIPVDDLIASL